MSEEHAPGPPDPGEPSLIDLGGLSLDDVARMDDSALAASLGRILGDPEDPDEPVLASFSATI